MNSDLNAVRSLAIKQIRARAEAQPDLWDDVTAIVRKHNPAVPAVQVRELAWAMVWAGWEASRSPRIKAQA